MDIVLRALFLYVFVVLLMRVMGRRELSSMTPFDLVLLIVLGDSIQQGLTQDEYSVTGAALAVGTIATLQVLTSYLSFRSSKARRVLEGEPIVLVERGEVVQKNLRRERMTEDEITEEMRQQDVSSLDQVEWAILENNGSISFIKKSSSWTCAACAAVSDRTGSRGDADPGRRGRCDRGLLPAHGGRRCAHRAAAAARAGGGTPPRHGRVGSRTRLRGRQGLRRLSRGRRVRGRAVRGGPSRANRRDRSRPPRPPPNRRRQRRRREAPRARGRGVTRRARLRLAGGDAGELHPRRTAGDRASRGVLPHRAKPGGVLQARRRGAGGEPPRSGRARRRRHDHDLARPGCPRRVAPARDARVRGRRQQRHVA